MTNKTLEVKVLVKRIIQRDLLQWESNPHDFLSRCFSRTMHIPFCDVTLQTASLLYFVYEENIQNRFIAVGLEPTMFDYKSNVLTN